jgi:hypothetical protein
MSTSDAPASISRRETLRRAAGALALGLGAPVTAFAADGDTDGRPSYRLSFWKGEEGEAFHTVRLSERDARKFVGREVQGYLKIDTLEGGAFKTVATSVFKF